MAAHISNRSHLIRSLLLAALTLLAATASWAQGTLWNGPLTIFTESAGANGTHPADQDRLTPAVWLTRDVTHGLFNAAAETSYTHFVSPADTEWSYGTLANYSSLTYTPWETWNGSKPFTMVNQAAVLHLVSENIYLTIEFTAWGGNAGGFTYLRSTPTVPEPSSSLLLLVALTLAGGIHYYRRRKPQSLS
ncbi:MAG: hypothetical protein JWR19_237 [Pedosphaera sp.]|nr:hypothetical protein [Pedosphaera sp.]